MKMVVKVEIEEEKKVIFYLVLRNKVELNEE
jgi:hypothetical protein